MFLYTLAYIQYNYDLLSRSSHLQFKYNLGFYFSSFFVLIGKSKHGELEITNLSIILRHFE